MSLETELKDCLCANGAALCGFGDLSKVTGGEWKTGVSVAVALPDEIVHSLPEGPTRAYREAVESRNGARRILGRVCVPPGGAGARRG